MDLNRRKRIRVVVISCLSILVAFIVLFQAIDMTRQSRIRKDITVTLTNKLVSTDLKGENRVRSSIGDYFIPDVTSIKLGNDLMNTLYPQVLERVNVFNGSGASPFFMMPPMVESTEPSSSADPTIYVTVEIKYAGLLGIVRNMQVMQSFPVPHYNASTPGLQ